MISCGLTDMFSDFFADSPGLAIFDPAVFGEAIHEYPVFFAFVAFWFGCCIGSFLNVCVYRLPLGMSLISPPSHCTHCDHVITPIENIPIFSYLCLRGKCRWCGAPISPKYLIGELTVGLLYMASFAYVVHFKLPLPSMFLYFLTVSVAFPAALIDMRVRLIPNELTYTLLILGPLFADYVAKKDYKGAVASVLIVVLTCILINLPFYLIDPSTSFDYLKYHTGRNIQIESVVGTLDRKSVV